ILLIDYTNQRREELGESNKEAALQAGCVRLRPILMTTLTTVLGMLPLSLGIGAGADFYQPLAIAVIGGLSVSTFFTLTFIPVTYYLVDMIMNLIKRFILFIFPYLKWIIIIVLTIVLIYIAVTLTQLVMHHGMKGAFELIFKDGMTVTIKTFLKSR
ncbi:efflux RND transporter permease subunit, partial [bacterium]|nr:efflux RND transporter permease subunit [bacterium]